MGGDILSPPQLHNSNAPQRVLHPLQNEWVLWEHKAAGSGGSSSSSSTAKPSHNNSSTSSSGPVASQQQWKDNMMELCHFDTVEAFWQYFAHVPKPSQVFFDGESRKKVSNDPSNHDSNNNNNNNNNDPTTPTSHNFKSVEEYSLFKKHIEPEWSDPHNITGGEWYCRQCFDPEMLDMYWQNLVLAVIGETIEANIHVDKNINKSKTSNPAAAPPITDYINGVRVLDKSRNYPLYKLEIWINTRDYNIRNRIKTLVLEQMVVKTDPATNPNNHHSNNKANMTIPKFEWKDHS